MQTFLPYPDFVESALVLDRARLGKQRLEVLSILKALLHKKGWIHHPATKMWAGYEGSLIQYGVAICNEWKRRGYKDNGTLDNIISYSCLINGDSSRMPWWLGDADFHSAHRSNLLRKSDWYLQFGWSESKTLPYVWPTNKSVV